MSREKSEIDEKIFPRVKSVAKSQFKINIISFKMFKVVKRDYWSEVHQPITKIDELTPNTELFMETEMKVDGRKHRLVTRCHVDESGFLEDTHSEMPEFGVTPDEVNRDQSLRKKIREVIEKYQGLIGTAITLAVNIALYIWRVMTGQSE